VDRHGSVSATYFGRGGVGLCDFETFGSKAIAGDGNVGMWQGG
jgi:hypothetical protein